MRFSAGTVIVSQFRALDHVGFTVSDLDRSSGWYSHLLGEEPAMRKTWEVGYIGEIVGYPECRMDCAFWHLPNEMVLELIQYLEPDVATIDMETYNAGNGHLCLISEDLDSDCERMRGRAQFRSERPIEIPWGPYKGGRVLYMRDPDGITVELIQNPADGPNFTT